MLRIRKEADLKELEKFGFKPKYDENTGKLKKYEKRDEQNNEIARISYIGNDHRYEPYFEIGWVCESNTLYDLIQARISRERGGIKCIY